MVSNATTGKAPHDPDGAVYVLACGDGADAVLHHVVSVCAALQLRCESGPALPLTTIPRGVALILYDGPTGDIPDPEACMRGVAVTEWVGRYIPLIVLTRHGQQSAADAELAQFVFSERLGHIRFDTPEDMTSRLRAALGEILSRQHFAAVARREDWPRMVVEGLRARHVAITPGAAQYHDISDISQVVGEAIWRQRKRALLNDSQAAVARAKVKAQEVLAAGYTLPIPIFAIVKQYGLTIVGKRPIKGWSGGLSGSGGVGAIELSPDEPETRRRFSCAHELGHFVLGHSELFPATRAARHSLLSYEVYDPLELAVNAFAAELLMPEAEVRQRVNAGVSLAVMARTFYVSMEAMRTRVEYLGL